MSNQNNGGKVSTVTDPKPAQPVVKVEQSIVIVKDILTNGFTPSKLSSLFKALDDEEDEAQTRAECEDDE